MDLPPRRSFQLVKSMFNVVHGGEPSPRLERRPSAALVRFSTASYIRNKYEYFTKK
jgi:hypothetical protein